MYWFSGFVQGGLFFFCLVFFNGVFKNTWNCKSNIGQLADFIQTSKTGLCHKNKLNCPSWHGGDSEWCWGGGTEDKPLHEQKLQRPPNKNSSKPLEPEFCMLLTTLLSWVQLPPQIHLLDFCTFISVKLSVLSFDLVFTFLIFLDILWMQIKGFLLMFPHVTLISVFASSEPETGYNHLHID